MVKEAVEQLGATPDCRTLLPIRRTSLAGEDHSAFFLTDVDQLEEQVCTIVGDGEIADLVDDQRQKAKGRLLGPRSRTGLISIASFGGAWRWLGSSGLVLLPLRRRWFPLVGDQQTQVQSLRHCPIIGDQPWHVSSPFAEL